MEIKIRSFFGYLDMIANVSGVVEEVTNEKVILKIKGKIYKGKIGFGKPIRGYAKQFDASKVKSYEKEDIILFSDPHDVRYVEELVKNGVHNFVFWNLNYVDYLEIIKYDITIIVLYEFSDTKYDLPQILENMDKKTIYLHPYTTIRAGIERPVIVI